MSAPSILAFVMAGGEGARLHPLTDLVPKPALTFGSDRRLIDFVLSNLYNSQIRAVYVLLQYRPQALLEHIATNWTNAAASAQEFVTPILPACTPEREPFRGTAHAVHQCLHLVDRHSPDLVAIFAADHLYRIDVRQMVDFHRQRRAAATVAAVSVPVENASPFGIIEADEAGRIRGFHEKPRNPARLPHAPDRAYASMGNYLFARSVLERALREAIARGESDFGHHVLPRLIRHHKVYAYDFGRNEVPGVNGYEERAYWRDVGTVDSYVDAHRDLLGAKPRFRIENAKWPIYGGELREAGRGYGNAGIRNSLFARGTVARGARLRNSIVQCGAEVETGAELRDSIVMAGVRVKSGARLRGAIVVGPNTITEAAAMRQNFMADTRRFLAQPSRVVVVPPRWA